jgi:hypothetical protein
MLDRLAEPGGIFVSGIVHDQVQGRLDCAFADIGEQTQMRLPGQRAGLSLPISRL